MYSYMYVYVYVRICVCVLARTYVRTRVCMYVCRIRWMDICMYVCMYVFKPRSIEWIDCIDAVRITEMILEKNLSLRCLCELKTKL